MGRAKEASRVKSYYSIYHEGALTLSSPVLKISPFGESVPLSPLEAPRLSGHVKYSMLSLSHHPPKILKICDPPGPARENHPDMLPFFAAPQRPEIQERYEYKRDWADNNNEHTHASLLGRFLNPKAKGRQNLT